VEDNGNVYGLAEDYKLSGNKGRDGFELWLMQTLLKDCGKDAAGQIAIAFHELNPADPATPGGGDVCVSRHPHRPAQGSSSKTARRSSTSAPATRPTPSSRRKWSPIAIRSGPKAGRVKQPRNRPDRTAISALAQKCLDAQGIGCLAWEKEIDPSASSGQADARRRCMGCKGV
jgi:hypothetical protein